ncbi:hypothetical protein F4806DRAFT_502928 [Annulohypoxylon nitens]|nr:hypothetical protein F4806DRAFT_502928 [Annulohypoxylon nitens]
MQQRFCDGLPVICSPSCDAVANSIRNCATQASGGSTDLPKTSESYYIPSPTSQLAEIGQQVQSQQSSSGLFPSAINTSIPAYQYPQVNSDGASPEGVWPTPPSTNCEEDVDSYSFHGSPVSVSCRAQPYSANSSVDSPGTWSAPDDQHFQMPAYNYPSYPQPQYNKQYFNQSSYEGQSYPRSDMNVNVMDQQELPSTAPSCVKSESEAEKPKPECTNTTKKVEEPYAQLIWKAFLSTPTHSMTLKELYQWFRDNTEKAKHDNPEKGKDETRGWMNSIRHNLSMNRAFVKRDRKPGPGETVAEPGESKQKLSEWFLEDWAINGVESTTRYRSKTTSNRQGGPGSRQRTRQSASGRVNSGRRGGVAASNSKRNAASRRAMITRNSHGPAFAAVGHSGNNPHDPMQAIGYDHRLGLQYSIPASIRNEHAASNPSHEGMMLANNPMQSTGLSAPDANHGFTFAPAMPTYSQNTQHPMYSMDDVTGIYQQHHGTMPTHGSQGLTSTIPQDLNGLFEDPEESRSRLAFSYWNDPTASSHYQP